MSPEFAFVKWFNSQGESDYFQFRCFCTHRSRQWKCPPPLKKRGMAVFTYSKTELTTQIVYRYLVHVKPILYSISDQHRFIKRPNLEPTYICNAFFYVAPTWVSIHRSNIGEYVGPISVQHRTSLVYQTDSGPQLYLYSTIHWIWAHIVNGDFWNRQSFGFQYTNIGNTYQFQIKCDLLKVCVFFFFYKHIVECP